MSRTIDRITGRIIGHAAAAVVAVALANSPLRAAPPTARPTPPLSAGTPASAPANVLVRALAKGDILARDDLVLRDLPVATARGALTPDEIVGREAVRALAPGRPLRAADLTRPQLVRRGEAVKLVLRSGGLLISSGGRALAGGSAGQAVRVVNLATNRTLDGIVETGGVVRIDLP